MDTDSDTDSDTDTGECANGFERCDGDIVQLCVDNSWHDWDDCSSKNAECILDGGEAVCSDIFCSPDHLCYEERACIQSSFCQDSFQCPSGSACLTHNDTTFCRPSCDIADDMCGCGFVCSFVGAETYCVPMP